LIQIYKILFLLDLGFLFDHIFKLEIIDLLYIIGFAVDGLLVLVDPNNIDYVFIKIQIIQIQIVN